MTAMLSTLPKRTVVLAGTATLLAVLLLARWISDWGLVTIHVKDAPLGKVIASIARQGHERVETSMDPETKVTMDADRVTEVEAVDQLAQITDSSWRRVIVAAPTKPAAAEGVAMLRAAPDPEGWNVFHYPLSPMTVPDDAVLDPGSLEWKVQGPDRDLAQLLDEAAQKSGAMIVMPKDWSATAPRLPETRATGRAVHELVGSVRGRDETFYYLTARERPRREEAPAGDRPQESVAAMTPAPARPAPNPEWLDQRIAARISTLPAPKQAEARREHEANKAFQEGLKNLTPEERRQKTRERMADPQFADKMAERMLLRDSRRTAQQRISRAVSYLNRKASIQAAQPR